MASAPIEVQPATPMGHVPKAVTDKRMTIPAQPHPGAQPMTVATDAGSAPSAPANDTPSAEHTPVSAMFNDPAIAAFLDPAPVQEPVAAVTPESQQPPQVPPAPPQPTQPQPAPGPAVSFDSMFSAPPEAPPQTGDNAELAALREQVASMHDMLANRAQTQAAPQPATPQYEISPEERATYGDSIALIERIAQAHAASILSSVDDRLTALEGHLRQSIQQVETGVADMRTSSYSQQLKLQVPDLNQLTNDPSFQAYIANTIPHSGGVTVGSRIREAHQRGDLATVVAFMNEFRASVSGGANTPAVPAIEQMAQPATTAAPAPAVAQPTVSRQPIPWSTRQQAARELRAGRLTQDAFNRIDQAYRNADAQGLVDYSS